MCVCVCVLEVMDLSRIEALAQKLYAPSNAREREMAEQALGRPVVGPETLSQCIFVIENSTNCYALVCCLVLFIPFISGGSNAWE